MVRNHQVAMESPSIMHRNLSFIFILVVSHWLYGTLLSSSLTFIPFTLASPLSLFLSFFSTHSTPLHSTSLHSLSPLTCFLFFLTLLSPPPFFFSTTHPSLVYVIGFFAWRRRGATNTLPLTLVSAQQNTMVAHLRNGVSHLLFLLGISS